MLKKIHIIDKKIYCITLLFKCIALLLKEKKILKFDLDHTYNSTGPVTWHKALLTWKLAIANYCQEGSVTQGSPPSHN